jgi:hypothetical protein
MRKLTEGLGYVTRFEGMKAYRCEDGTIRLFRPDMNMHRMNRVSIGVEANHIALKPDGVTDELRSFGNCT